MADTLLTSPVEDSSDDEFHDANEINALKDSIILTTKRLSPSVGPEQTKDRRTSQSNASEQKRRIMFKEGDNLVTEFPNKRLWEPDMTQSPDDMIRDYKDACAVEKQRPLQKLLEQLERMDALTTPIDTLDLSSARLEPRTCETLEMILSKLLITSLDIQKSNIEDDGMIAICEMIDYYECVSRLIIAHNPKLKSRAWLSLGRTLKNAPFIEMLNASYCGIDNQGLTLLLRSVRANCALHTLHLSGNNLSGKGSFILMAAMKFNENLQELYISNNNLLPEDAQNLGAILRINHTLKVLDIKDNNIQDSGLHYICVGLAEQQTGLISLNISNNNFTPMGMEHLAAMLPCTRSLQDINLCHNRVGDSGILAMKLSLLVNRSLTKLLLMNTRLTCEGAIALAEILAENRHLKYLDIRDNDIRIAGLMALSLAHKINHRLLQLDVPKNIKSDQRDRPMISNLLSEIESYTLRNVQEREQVRSPVDRSATEEPLTPEAKQLEIEGRKKLSSDGGGEDTDSRPPPEDPFEAVVPVLSETDKPDEKKLDKLVEFEHHLEDPSDVVSGEETSQKHALLPSANPTGKKSSDSSQPSEQSSLLDDMGPSVEGLPDLLEPSPFSSTSNVGTLDYSETRQPIASPPAVTDLQDVDLTLPAKGSRNGGETLDVLPLPSHPNSIQTSHSDPSTLPVGLQHQSGEETMRPLDLVGTMENENENGTVH